MHSNILSIPWTPTANGELCDPYFAYDVIAEEGTQPNPFEDEQWDRNTLDSQLVMMPDGGDALWEGILALWRLRLVQEDGAFDRSWRTLVSAWLQRHSELCKYLQIAHFEVVLDYVHKLLQAQAISVDMIPTEMVPSWAQPNAVPKPGPEPEATCESGPVSQPIPVPDPTPTSRQKRITRQNAATTSSAVISISDSDDVEVVDLVGTPIAAPRRKDKGKSRALPSPSPGQSEPQEFASDVAATGSKRARQGSSARASKKPRRVRGEPMLATNTQRLDLSAYTFAEDTEVDIGLVPALKGQICEFCRPGGKACVPTWHRMRKKAAIRCGICVDGKRGCSFKREDWGIDTWPHLLITEAAARRRRKEAEAKRRGTSSSVKEPSAGPSVINRGQNLTKPRMIMQDVYITTPVPKFKRPAKPIPAVATSTHSIFLAGLQPFRSAIPNPRVTATEVLLQAVALRKMAIRELAEVDALLHTCAERLPIIERLAQQLSDAGTDSEEKDTDDDWSSDGGEGGSRDESQSYQDAEDSSREGGE